MTSFRVDSARFGELEAVATAFRAAIEQSRAERATPALPYFPEGACRLVSRLLAVHLGRRDPWGSMTLRLASGHLPSQEQYVRHTWLLVDDVIVDLTADSLGKAPVIVGHHSSFHAALDAREDEPASAVLAGLSPDEARRLDRLLVPIEERIDR